MPARFKDFLPGSSTHLAHMPLSAHQQHVLHSQQHPLPPDDYPASPTSPSSSSSSPDEPQLIPFTTQPDQFGLFRVYANEPSHVLPETLENLIDAPTLLSEPSGFDVAAARARLGVPGVELSSQEIFAPFTNPSSGILMAWQYSGTSQKSGAELDRLARLLSHPLYNSHNLAGFSYSREEKRIDKYLESKNNPFQAEYGWHKSSVKIRLPKEKVKHPSEFDAHEIAVDVVWHRDLTDVIIDVFQSDTSLSFHMTPFSQHWKVTKDKVINIYSEVFSSPEMLRAYKEVNSLPREAGNDIERVIAGLMLWSDSTHLTNFGDASMWPFYLFFGNQSKYDQHKPISMACHHIAYIPKVSCVIIV
jgi:hypothetical protein